MIDFLLGVPGKLKTISDYLTGTLYPYITTRTANLDTTVSSRAAASTALTNATWTDTRASYLDAPVSSLTQINSPLLKAPIAANFAWASGSKSGAGYVTVLNLTGCSGVLNWVGASSNNSNNGSVRLTVDGVYLGSCLGTSAGGVPIVGSQNGAFDQIPFYSSVLIEVAGDLGTIGYANWKLRRTT